MAFVFYYFFQASETERVCVEEGAIFATSGEIAATERDSLAVKMSRRLSQRADCFAMKRNIKNLGLSRQFAFFFTENINKQGSGARISDQLRQLARTHHFVHW